VHVWAELFDRDTADLFTLQNEITGRIAIALDRELVDAEAARPTEHPDALDYILRARAAASKLWSPESLAEAIKLFEHALVLDPQSVYAQSGLAQMLEVRVLTGMTTTPAADLLRAEGLVDQALAASPRYASAHTVKGQVLRARNRWEEAIPEYEMALELNRNSVGALEGLCWCKLYSGMLDEVIPLAEQVIRLSPRDRHIGFTYLLIGTVHLLALHTEEAIIWLEKARHGIPGTPIVRSRLASAYALRGETERAAAELAEARRLNGGDLFASIANVRAGGVFGGPKSRALFEATYLAGLRKAGMPEK
jgi:tetratricopeptide (TPR) repeat protein